MLLFTCSFAISPLGSLFQGQVVAASQSELFCLNISAKARTWSGSDSCESSAMFSICQLLEHLMSGNRRTGLKTEEEADLWACISPSDSEADSWLRGFHCSLHRTLLSDRLAAVQACALRLPYESASFMPLSLLPLPSQSRKGRAQESSTRWAEGVDAISFSQVEVCNLFSFSF